MEFFCILFDSFLHFSCILLRNVHECDILPLSIIRRKMHHYYFCEKKAAAARACMKQCDTKGTAVTGLITGEGSVKEVRRAPGSSGQRTGPYATLRERVMGGSDRDRRRCENGWRLQWDFCGLLQESADYSDGGVRPDFPECLQTTS